MYSFLYIVCIVLSVNMQFDKYSLKLVTSLLRFKFDCQSVFLVFCKNILCKLLRQIKELGTKESRGSVSRLTLVIWKIEIFHAKTFCILVESTVDQIANANDYQ